MAQNTLLCQNDWVVSRKRIDAIDQFRGLAIVLMVLANFLAGVELVPAWLKHAPDIGLTVIDLIAPFFIFAIGVTYGISYRRRLGRDGAAKTISHFLTRFLALIGVGALLSAGEYYFGESTAPVQWGVLQAIGVAGLLSMPLLNLPQAWRCWPASRLCLTWPGRVRCSARRTAACPGR